MNEQVSMLQYSRQPPAQKVRIPTKTGEYDRRFRWSMAERHLFALVANQEY